MNFIKDGEITEIQVSTKLTISIIWIPSPGVRILTSPSSVVSRAKKKFERKGEGAVEETANEATLGHTVKLTVPPS